MGGAGCLACQGLLFREVYASVLVVELDFFSLECKGVSSSEF